MKRRKNVKAIEVLGELSSDIIHIHYNLDFKPDDYKRGFNKAIEIIYNMIMKKIEELST